MKTTFTLDQVKQLLVLNPEQQQQIIGFSDSLTETTDEEIVSMAVADDAPEMIRDLHRRARAAHEPPSRAANAACSPNTKPKTTG